MGQKDTGGTDMATRVLININDTAQFDIHAPEKPRGDIRYGIDTPEWFSRIIAKGNMFEGIEVRY